jgi:large subunit ribosomal protein L20
MRVKGGSQARKSKNRILRQAKGFWTRRHACIKQAMIGVRRSKQQAYAGRKWRKRQLRNLWIIRVNAAVRSLGLRYSQFVHAANKAQVGLDRKMLAEIAVRDPKAFEAVVATAKRAL